MQRKASENFFARCWCVLLLQRSLHLINISFFNWINIIFSFSDNRIECNRGGAKQAERCPVQPSDLVFIHNHIMAREALAKQDTKIWNAARNLKAPTLSKTEFASRLLNIVSSAKMKVKQPLRVLRASFLTGEVGLLWQGNK